MYLYAEVPLGSEVVLPDHRVRAEVRDNDGFLLELFPAVMLAPMEFANPPHPNVRVPKSTFATAHRGDGQTIITGPGPVSAYATAVTVTDVAQLDGMENMVARFELEPVFTDSVLSVVVSLPSRKPEGNEARPLGNALIGCRPPTRIV